jgi:hypothetical protein
LHPVLVIAKDEKTFHEPARPGRDLLVLPSMQPEQNSHGMLRLEEGTRADGGVKNQATFSDAIAFPRSDVKKARTSILKTV